MINMKWADNNQVTEARTYVTLYNGRPKEIARIVFYKVGQSAACNLWVFKPNEMTLTGHAIVTGKQIGRAHV